MTYELAKKLKDAGFIQKGDKDYPVFWFLKSGALFLDSIEKAPEDAVYIPILPELIEACDRWPNQFSLYGRNKNRWEATSVSIEEGHVHVREIGETPEEAVANLYLALKKHD